MSALYEKSQLTKILISSLPATKETMDSATFLDLICYQRCKTDPPQRLKIDPGVNLLL
ncbi:hypothetical protein L369_03031 [Enterobacter sp. MGH 23]|nr:hypothetical protein L369_03031 [Enterobacter sp. MGH 23]MCK6725769.1 hypothetical protein [Enterobacter kobei]